jgi:hypothetical protein
MRSKILQLLFFRSLARINKILLPKYSKRDLTQLTTFDKLIIAYRSYVTKNSLE